MIPDIAWVVRKRYHVRRRLLHMSLILFILAVMPIASVLLAITIALMGPGDFGIYRIESWLNFIFMFAFPGALIWLFHTRLARWLVPIPKAACPKCLYALRNLTNSRCPECGLDLPGEMVNQADSD